MSLGGILSTTKNSMTARCWNHISSQPSISTGTEPELWRVVGSLLGLVEERYHVAAWNRIYAVFINLIKKYMTEDAKLFSLSSFNPMSEVTQFLILSNFRHLCIVYSRQECYFTGTFRLFVGEGSLLYKPEGRGFDSRWCHWNF